MSLADDFDAPITETIGGETVSFPLLTCDDLTAIERWHFNEKKLKVVASLSATDARARQEVENYFAEATLSINELATVLGSVPGAKKAIALSLARSTTPKPPEAVAHRMSRERGWLGVVELARIISTLWPITRKAATPPPNDSAAIGEKPVAGTTETKDSLLTGSGYGEPTASIPAL